MALPLGLLLDARIARALTGDKKREVGGGMWDGEKEGLLVTTFNPTHDPSFSASVEMVEMFSAMEILMRV